jgi:putative transposase
MDYQHDKHHVYLLNYHLIWCPKRRKKILVGNIKVRLEQIIRQVAKELGVEVLALEIMPDHLHLFVSSNPNLCLPKLVQSFKGKSSHDLRIEFPELNRLPSLWTHSYFVSTAGNISAESIQKYIEAQSIR